MQNFTKRYIVGIVKTTGYIKLKYMKILKAIYAQFVLMQKVILKNLGSKKMETEIEFNVTWELVQFLHSVNGKSNIVTAGHPDNRVRGVAFTEECAALLIDGATIYKRYMSAVPWLPFKSALVILAENPNCDYLRFISSLKIGNTAALKRKGEQPYLLFGNGDTYKASLVTEEFFPERDAEYCITLDKERAINLLSSNYFGVKIQNGLVSLRTVSSKQQMDLKELVGCIPSTLRGMLRKELDGDASPSSQATIKKSDNIKIGIPRNFSEALQCPAIIRIRTENNNELVIAVKYVDNEL